MRRSPTSKSRSRSSSTTAASSCAPTPPPAERSGIARPVARALHRTLPERQALASRIARERRFEIAVARPERCDLGLVLPETDREAGGGGSAEPVGLRDARPHDGNP